ncbi:MAG: methyl-accepting chemotaxis protein, partial [Verrucomicrobiales bacterium]|nr:methyl-accepting chemotaxis protein [Verrucomicrobiales bacterium]
MKNTSIGRRLTTVQLLIIGMLLAGVALALWGVQTRSRAVEENAGLADAANRIRLNLIQMSDAFRGQLLNPGHDLYPVRRRAAYEDFRKTAVELKSAWPERAGLVAALESLAAFVQDDLRPFHESLEAQLHTDPATAIARYNAAYDELRKQRDKLFNEVEYQVRAISTEKHLSAQGIAIACLGFAAVLVVLTFVLARRHSSAVSQPLQELIAAIERMGRGDFTQRVKLKQPDEFGVLAEGLNRLADDLSALVGQVQRSGIQVNTTATQIAATAREQQTTASEIAATTAQIGATAREISATSRELDKTMSEVSQVAEDTTQLANSGQSAITRMESTMRQIMEASSAVTAKLALLSEKTANINSVVTTITKVADQTNLLSLNAAIEAEKAGEYGLGFAVVAMEIRRLADQTAVATYDIEKMVKEMQSAVAAGVMGMDKFSEEVRRGVEEIRQVSAQLAQIIHQVQTLTPRFQTVTEGMHAQATGAQQISETLLQLNEAAQQTA